MKIWLSHMFPPHWRRLSDGSTHWFRCVCQSIEWCRQYDKTFLVCCIAKSVVQANEIKRFIQLRL